MHVSSLLFDNSRDSLAVWSFHGGKGGSFSRREVIGEGRDNRLGHGILLTMQDSKAVQLMANVWVMSLSQSSQR
jgi:hypothetical protein